MLPSEKGRKQKNQVLQVLLRGQEQKDSYARWSPKHVFMGLITGKRVTALTTNIFPHAAVWQLHKKTQRIKLKYNYIRKIHSLLMPFTYLLVFPMKSSGKCYSAPLWFVTVFHL